MPVDTGYVLFEGGCAEGFEVPIELLRKHGEHVEVFCFGKVKHVYQWCPIEGVMRFIGSREVA